MESLNIIVEKSYSIDILEDLDSYNTILKIVIENLD
jgi:hypothetical protein